MRKIGFWLTLVAAAVAVAYLAVPLGASAVPAQCSNAAGEVKPVLCDDNGAAVVSSWGAWTVVDSQITNVNGDGGTISQSPTPATCEDCVVRTGDVCLLRQTGTYPVTPVGTCALTTLDTATLRVLQASTGCWPMPSPAVTPSNDAGVSDATLYSLEAVTGTPTVTILRRCRR